jgi:hypothetical protein
MNFHRGDAVCSNRVRMRRDVLETKLLAGLQEKVLCEDVVNYTLDRFEQKLEREPLNIGGEMDRMRKRKAELETEIARLTASLASGLYSVTVMAEIARREKEICRHRRQPSVFTARFRPVQDSEAAPEGAREDARAVGIPR